MPRKFAPTQIDSLSIKQLLALLIEEIQSWQSLERQAPTSHPESDPATTSQVALDQPFFTISQVAERLNLSDRQVRYAINKGLIEANRFEGKGPGAIRVPAHSLVAYIERCRVRPSQNELVRKSLPKGKPFKHIKVSAPEGRGSSLGS
ncbi:hypothetical protein BH23PLA1_BH23PLA1_17920 [soil metagenome]